MAVRVRRNFPPLGSLPLVTPQLMREIGDLAVRLIRTRTEGGRDVQNRAFRPLSEAYRREKRKHLGHSRADLTVSGRMLGDMDVTNVTRNQATIGFRSAGRGGGGGTFIQRSRAVGAADKAFFHNEAGAGRSRVIREFLGLPPREVRQLEDAVRTHLTAVAGR